MNLKISMRSQDRDAIRKATRAITKALNESGVGYKGPIAPKPVQTSATKLRHENLYREPTPVTIKTYSRIIVCAMTPQALDMIRRIKIPDTVEITFKTVTEEEN